MVNQKRFIIIVSGIIALVLAIACSLMLTRAVGVDFNTSIGHFSADSISNVAFIIMAVGAALSLAPGFFLKGVCLNTEAGAGIAVSFVSVFTGALLMASSVFGFFDAGVSLPESYAFLTTLAGIFGCLGAVSLFLFSIQGAYRSKMAKLCSMCVPLFFIARILALYFDTSCAFNSTTKVFAQLAFAAFALAGTFDSGLYLSKPVLGRYIFGSMVSVILGAPLGVASLSTQFTTAGSFPLSVVDTCMICGFALLSAVKLYHVARSLKGVGEDAEASNEAEDEPQTEKAVAAAEIAEESHEE